MVILRCLWLVSNLFVLADWHRLKQVDRICVQILLIYSTGLTCFGQNVIVVVRYELIILKGTLEKVNSKIVLYLSPKADDETRQRFFVAVDQISEVLKGGVKLKNKNDESRIRFGAVEKKDMPSGVVWISVFDSEHILICKMLSKLLMERNRVGDKCEIILNPKPTLK